MFGLATKIHQLYNQQLKQFHKNQYGNCAVLLYHRVTNLNSDPQQLSVTPENFDAQIFHLKKHHPVLLIDELKFHLEKKKKFPANAVAITFDDGYADNYHEALPILEKYDAQALFYISTGTLNTHNEFWWDEVERIVLLNENLPAEKEFLLGRNVFDLENLNRERRFKLYERLLLLFRKMQSIDRDKKIKELSLLFNVPAPRSSHRALSFEELKKMSESESAVIGAHTHLHPSLGALSYDQQLNEIKTSKQMLEKILQKVIVHFSFPFGTANDFNRNTIAICKNLNFEMVAANYPYIVHKNTAIFQYPRFIVRNWDIEQFKKEVNKFLN